MTGTHKTMKKLNGFEIYRNDQFIWYVSPSGKQILNSWATQNKIIPKLVRLGKINKNSNFVNWSSVIMANMVDRGRQRNRTKT